MYSVYILRSKTNPKKSYVGMTIKKVKNREVEHNQGKCQYTKAFIPWELIYYEQFHCKTCAEAREKFLKSGIGFRLRKLISNNINYLKFGKRDSALQKPR